MWVRFNKQAWSESKYMSKWIAFRCYGHCNQCVKQHGHYSGVIECQLMPQDVSTNKNAIKMFNLHSTTINPKATDFACEINQSIHLPNYHKLEQFSLCIYEYYNQVTRIIYCDWTRDNVYAALWTSALSQHAECAHIRHYLNKSYFIDVLHATSVKRNTRAHRLSETDSVE